MDIFLIILAGLLIIIGVIGCFLPILPGPPISFIGLLIFEASSYGPFSNELLFTYLALTIVITALDYVIPAIGTKVSGGTKRGIWGASIGIVVGLFLLPPVGVIIFPFIGAVLGEMTGGKEFNSALKSGFAAFVGLLTGIILKLLLSGAMAFSYVKALINVL